MMSSSPGSRAADREPGRQGGELERQETLLLSPPLFFFSYGIQTADRAAPSWRPIKAFVRPCRVAVCGNWLDDKVFSYTFTYSEQPGRDSGPTLSTLAVFTSPPPNLRLRVEGGG